VNSLTTWWMMRATSCSGVLCSPMETISTRRTRLTHAGYDLTRLRRNGLIAKRAHSNTYDLPPGGLKFAIFYTKVHDRVLRPVFATGQPQAAPELTAAMRSIERHLDDRLAQVRLPAAA
jgi:hypothetical protein